MGEIERPPEAETADRGRTAIYIANNSREPVYSVVVGIVFIQGAGPHTIEDMITLNRTQYERRGPVTTANLIPGGLYRVWIAGAGWHQILSGRNGADVAFTDCAGSHWIRRATGALNEIGEPPLAYLAKLGFHGPHDFVTPEHAAAG